MSRAGIDPVKRGVGGADDVLGVRGADDRRVGPGGGVAGGVGEGQVALHAGRGGVAVNRDAGGGVDAEVQLRVVDHPQEVGGRVEVDAVVRVAADTIPTPSPIPVPTSVARPPAGSIV